MREDLNKRIHKYLIAAIAFCLPINSYLIPPLIFVASINWVLSPYGITKGLKSIIKNKSILSMTILFILYAFSILYSSDIESSMPLLETKLSLIILPLIFSTRIKTINENFVWYLRLFIYGCVASALICLSWALYCYLKPVYVIIDGAEYYLGASYFYYSQLSVFLHSSYISMYFNFALLSIFYLIHIQEIKLNWIWVATVFLIATFILLLSSKSGWIGLFLVFTLVGINLFLKKMYFKLITITVTLSALFYILNVSAPTYSQRIRSATESISMAESEDEFNHKHSGTTSRILVWKAAIDIIKDNLFLGTGIGDTKKAMLEKYKEKNMKSELASELNSHNQFLNTFVSLGIVGFTYLTLSFLLPLIFAIKHKKILLGAFVCLVGSHFLTESMLETQAGVMFYAFFNSLLCFQSYSQNKKQQLTPDLNP